jgi:hypothetical protein
MRATILFLICATACALDVAPSTSDSTQALQVPCDYDDDGNPIYCSGGGGGGGGAPVNRCSSVTSNCDPTLLFGLADQACQTMCLDSNAVCQHSYTCPAGTDTPICHLGYCADWR